MENKYQTSRLSGRVNITIWRPAVSEAWMSPHDLHSGTTIRWKPSGIGFVACLERQAWNTRLHLDTSTATWHRSSVLTWWWSPFAKLLTYNGYIIVRVMRSLHHGKTALIKQQHLILLDGNWERGEVGPVEARGKFRDSEDHWPLTPPNVPGYFLDPAHPSHTAQPNILLRRHGHRVLWEREHLCRAYIVLARSRFHIWRCANLSINKEKVGLCSLLSFTVNSHNLNAIFLIYPGAFQ